MSHIWTREKAEMAILNEQLRVRGERMETMFKYNKDVFGVLPAEWLGWFDADGQVNPPDMGDTDEPAET